MAKNQKYIFLQALIITFLIFNIGIFMGYKLESSRIDKIDNWYLKSEIELLDQKLQKDAYEIVGLNCDLLFEENIKFADRIYQEALNIEDYEEANKFSKEIILQHKRYDLLRTLFWMNSLRIKEDCNLKYHNVVYFYDSNEPSLEQSSKQRFFSNLLYELKQKKGNEIMLIPIAGDNELPSLNLLMKKYGIIELPVILIDEEIVVTDIDNIEDVEKYLN
jgi:hypothetical protein